MVKSVQVNEINHKSFADKHLGGHGSADHKAYKAKIK